MRFALAAGGLYMVMDALISMRLSTDTRPAIQAGRAARGAIGLGLGATALLLRAPKETSAAGFWLATLASVTGSAVVAAALYANGQDPKAAA